MRTTTVALALAVASSSAAAQPVTSPTECEVRFVRAPDEVRYVIEAWLQAEPRCTTSIDLRVVATADGYYLLAQRSDGRIHERVVPDAQSAGVLVASWVADDRIDPPPRPRALAPLIVDPFVSDTEISAQVPARSSRSPKWFSLAGMIRAGGGGGSGVRGELDLIAFGRWTVGAALTASHGFHTSWTLGGPGPSTYETADLKTTGYLVRTSTFGRWQLRIAGGAGVLHTSTSLTSMNTSSSGALGAVSGSTPVAEGSVSLSRQVGDHWSVTAGPLVSWMSQELLTWNPYSWDPQATIGGRNSELMFLAGMRHQL